LVKIRFVKVPNFLHPRVCRQLAHCHVVVTPEDSRSQPSPSDDKSFGNTSGNALLNSLRKV